MKKLNRKGFTLVELLAVIIILAIVVGITIPAVLTMVDNAREKAGQDAAAVMADWIDKQYSLDLIGLGGVTDAYKAACTTSSSYLCDSDNGATHENTDGNTIFTNLLKTAGLTPGDVDAIRIIIGEGDRSCVVIKAKSGGNFYVNRYANTAGKNIYYSNNCAGDETIS